MEQEITDEEYLIECARQGEYEEVLNCIKAGVGINSKNEHKNTPLRLIFTRYECCQQSYKNSRSTAP